MEFHRSGALVFVPDGLPSTEALARTTHMGIGAHPDDVEVMAIDGILRCFRRDDRWFCGVAMTDGSGAPREGGYEDASDAEMRAIRREEQRKAAVLGEYGAQVLLDYSSAAVKDGANGAPVRDLVTLLRAARPEVVYTHNPADRHETHVATALRVIAALRKLPATERPRRVYGCEVWRSLDWMVEADRVALDVSGREHLQAALLSVFDSQISGGKRYDLATMGRRRANATYHAARRTDAATGVVFAMDLTPLVEVPQREVSLHVAEMLDRFSHDVLERLERLG